MATVFQIALLRLWNNKQEMLLIFVVPILFFSIFALIFSRGIGGGTAVITVLAVDDDRSEFSERLLEMLREHETLKVTSSVARTNSDWPVERISRYAIQRDEAEVVVYLPEGLQERVQEQLAVSVGLLGDSTDPISRQMVRALLAQAAASVTAAFASRPDPPSATYARRLGADSVNEQAVATESAGRELISFVEQDLFADDKSNPKIAMYAAGIAVMFLLFSASGAGGSLLEEEEAGTLDRLLCSRLSLTQLLAGKWLYVTVLGFVQITVMFVWAQLIFGVDLQGHLAGFAAMTLCTAAATASLAICLAVFCRSRAQLNGVSVVLILTMSALGGSMVPRYIMSDEMKRLGKLTFNAWALDGYQKVFWYDQPLSAVGSELVILGGIAIYLAILARMFAHRWEVN